MSLDVHGVCKSITPPLLQLTETQGTFNSINRSGGCAKASMATGVEQKKHQWDFCSGHLNFDFVFENDIFRQSVFCSQKFETHTKNKFSRQNAGLAVALTRVAALALAPPPLTLIELNGSWAPLATRRH